MEFKDKIINIIEHDFPGKSQFIIDKSLLVQYLIKKTVSANRGSKSRGSFANIYAVYVLVEDYIKRGYASPRKNKACSRKNYSEDEGAQYTELLSRMRQLPFGEKLQNHALNNRMSAEFQKYFPDAHIEPIPRDLERKRYWINENLLIINLNGSKTINIAKTIIKIINEYIETKQSSFSQFVKTCESLQTIGKRNLEQVRIFVESLITPNQDARLFEIVSFSILKYFYHDQIIYWGFDRNNIQEDKLTLYKTGRTNANDGGIDFVMKPLGRFFQVTETLDFKKYFLDIDKIERYPITFVIKTTENIDEIKSILRKNAEETYSVNRVVEQYMKCIEEIINIPILLQRFKQSVSMGYLSDILSEIILQSKVEFNLDIE